MLQAFRRFLQEAITFSCSGHSPNILLHLCWNVSRCCPETSWEILFQHYKVVYHTSILTVNLSLKIKYLKLRLGFSSKSFSFLCASVPTIILPACPDSHWGSLESYNPETLSSLKSVPKPWLWQNGVVPSVSVIPEHNRMRPATQTRDASEWEQSPRHLERQV
jgi:hypothetical protein